MSDDKTYNGYTNYETWNCALWLDNDQGTQEMMQEKAQELVDGMTDVNDEKELMSVKYELSKYIESMVDEMQEALCPGLGASMFSDLLNASLREIDYYDIAESQLADALHEARKAA